jgi:hypothetical protein
MGIINNLRVADFRRTDGQMAGPLQTGFIAQEVQKVYPAMVSTTPDGYLSIRQDMLIPVMIKGIQELASSASTQQSQISSIGNEVQNSSDQIVDLQSQLTDQNLTVNQRLNLFGATLAENSTSIQTIETQQVNDETRIKSLEDQMAMMEEKYQAIVSFANMLDDKGNMNLLGGELEANGVVAGAFTVKVTEKDRPTIGSETIHIYKDEDLDGTDDNFPGNDGKSIEVLTKAVTATSKIFVTPQGDAGGSVWVEKEMNSDGSYKGFVIKTTNVVRSDVKIDWFIVEEK